MVGPLAARCSAAVRRRQAPVTVLVATFGILAAACGANGHASSHGVTAVNHPSQSLPAPGVLSAATVGVLFGRSLSGSHICTASVVASASGNVIVTAAHCVHGTGAGMLFVPGYYKGNAPYGAWVVHGTYVPAGWLSDRDPHDDVAFMTVSPAAGNPEAGRTVQQVVGANRIGPIAADETVTVIGYGAGRNDAPLVCAARVYLTSGFPSFDCDGYVDGTSGSPWLAEFDSHTGSGVLTAVIGGLRQGGCTADTSYGAAVSGAPIRAALARAEAAGPADSVPSASSGC